MLPNPWGWLPNIYVLLGFRSTVFTNSIGKKLRKNCHIDQLRTYRKSLFRPPLEGVFQSKNTQVMYKIVIHQYEVNNKYTNKIVIRGPTKRNKVIQNRTANVCNLLSKGMEIGAKFKPKISILYIWGWLVFRSKGQTICLSFLKWAKLREMTEVESKVIYF